jgi:serpin B
MMSATELMTYAADEGWRMVTLGTRSPVVFDLLLPDTGRGLEIDAATLRGLYAGGRSARVDLRLPRLALEAGADLTGPLGELGLHRAFSGEADFSGMTTRPVTLDRVVHKAVLRVDEQGFEGAAATAMIMRALAMSRPATPIPFHVDRPYLVMVRHQNTGAIYFMARVLEP